MLEASLRNTRIGVRIASSQRDMINVRDLAFEVAVETNVMNSFDRDVRKTEKTTP